MSADQADGSAKQFDQSTPKASTQDRHKDSRLHEQYKPVGIPAVSAAAQFASKSKKTPQMS